LPEKTETLRVFSGLEPAVLYRLAALPDEIAATLTPDTLLTDPRTGRQTALSQMSAHLSPYGLRRWSRRSFGAMIN